MRETEFIKVFTDATARGNPGHSGMGIVILDSDDEIIKEYHQYIGVITNNQAEYSAIVKSLELIKELDTTYNRIDFYSDSELMVKQLTGRYKIKDENLKILAHKFLAGIKILDKAYTITHILRSKNKLADVLANKATDDFLQSKKSSLIK